MRPTRPLALTALALAASAALAWAPRAHATPEMARAESLPCARCHTSAPALNAFGLGVLGRGDRLPGAPAHVLAGGVPPLTLSTEFGAALLAADTASAGGGRASRVTSEFRAWTLRARTQGRLAPGIAFDAEADVDSAGGTVRLPVLAARFDDLAGGALAVRVGRFEAGLPFLSPERSPLLSPFLAPVAIAAEGVELQGVRRGWTAAAGITNSERTLANVGDNVTSFSRIENQYVWAMREARGQFAGARLLFGRQPSDISYHAWLQRLQLVIGASLGGERVRLQPAYVLDRLDDRPAPGIHQRQQYAVLEGVAQLDPAGTNTLALRVEHGHLTPTVLTAGEDHDREAARLARWLAPGVRLAVEGSHTGDNLGRPHEVHVDASVTLVF